MDIRTTLRIIPGLMAATTLTAILDSVLQEAPTRAVAPRTTARRFDYTQATPRELEAAVSQIKRLLDGPLAAVRREHPAVLDDIELFIERIVAGKLSHLQPEAVEKWFTKGAVRQPDGRTLSLSTLARLARQIRTQGAALGRTGDRIAELEGRGRQRKEGLSKGQLRSLENAHDRQSAALERLHGLVWEFRDSLASIAMLVAQE